MPWEEVSNEMDVRCLRLVLRDEILITGDCAREKFRELSLLLILETIDGLDVAFSLRDRQCAPV